MDSFCIKKNSTLPWPEQIERSSSHLTYSSLPISKHKTTNSKEVLMNRTKNIPRNCHISKARINHKWAFACFRIKRKIGILLTIEGSQRNRKFWLRSPDSNVMNRARTVKHSNKIVDRSVQESAKTTNESEFWKEYWSTTIQKHQISSQILLASGTSILTIAIY